MAEIWLLIVGYLLSAICFWFSDWYHDNEVEKAIKIQQNVFIADRKLVKIKASVLLGRFHHFYYFFILSTWLSLTIICSLSFLLYISLSFPILKIGIQFTGACLGFYLFLSFVYLIYFKKPYILIIAPEGLLLYIEYKYKQPIFIPFEKIQEIVNSDSILKIITPENTFVINKSFMMRAGKAYSSLRKAYEV